MISYNGGIYCRPIMVTYAENARIVNVAPYLPHLNSDLTVVVIINNLQQEVLMKKESNLRNVNENENSTYL